MKAFIVVIFVLFYSTASLADDSNAAGQIQGVIVSQLTALKNGDASAAWVHAHPSIKAKFSTPERFIAMVIAGYSPMVKFVQIEFAALVPDDGVWVQMVRLQDEAGSWYDIVYALMETEPGQFQIAGVSLESSSAI